MSSVNHVVLWDEGSVFLCCLVVCEEEWWGWNEDNKEAPKFESTKLFKYVGWMGYRIAQSSGLLSTVASRRHIPWVRRTTQRTNIRMPWSCWERSVKMRKSNTMVDAVECVVKSRNENKVRVAGIDDRGLFGVYYQTVRWYILCLIAWLCRKQFTTRLNERGIALLVGSESMLFYRCSLHRRRDSSWNRRRTRRLFPMARLPSCSPK